MLYNRDACNGNASPRQIFMFWFQWRLTRNGPVEKISFITNSFLLSFSRTASVMCCLTNAVTGVIYPGSSAVFSSKNFMKVLYREQHLILQLTGLNGSLQLIILVITFSKIHDEKFLVFLVPSQHSVAKTLQIISSADFRDIL